MIKKSAAFGAMADLGIHKTDLMNYLLDDTIVSAMAITGTLDKKNTDGTPITVDDNAICIYQTKKGAVGTMEVSWTCYGEEDKSTVLYGSEGCLKINADPRYPLVLEKKSGERIFYNIDKYGATTNGSGIIDTWISCLKKSDASFNFRRLLLRIYESCICCFRICPKRTSGKGGRFTNLMRA